MSVLEIPGREGEKEIVSLVVPPQQLIQTDLLTGAGGHWRTRAGELILSVPNKNGQGSHTTTLRDARALDLVPSVTTVLGFVDKPLVDIWKVEKALEAYIAFPFGGKDHAIEEMKKLSRDAADLGTAIHAAVAQGFEGFRVVSNSQISHIIGGFWQWYATSGLDCQQAEHSFVNNRLGYCGTIDFEGTLNGEPVIADFKSDDSKTNKDFQYHEPEYPLQLAGYDNGVGQNRKRLTIKISRNVPGLIGVKVWQDNERWTAAWNSLWETWQNVKNYYPAQGLRVVK
jgi:hypothetical protein